MEFVCSAGEKGVRIRTRGDTVVQPLAWNIIVNQAGNTFLRFLTFYLPHLGDWMEWFYSLYLVVNELYMENS